MAKRETENGWKLSSCSFFFKNRGRCENSFKWILNVVSYDGLTNALRFGVGLEERTRWIWRVQNAIRTTYELRADQWLMPAYANQDYPSCRIIDSFRGDQIFWESNVAWIICVSIVFFCSMLFCKCEIWKRQDLLLVSFQCWFQDAIVKPRTHFKI